MNKRAGIVLLRIQHQLHLNERVFLLEGCNDSFHDFNLIGSGEPGQLNNDRRSVLVRKLDAIALAGNLLD